MGKRRALIEPDVIDLHPIPSICGAASSLAIFMEYLQGHARYQTKRLKELNGSISIEAIEKTFADFGFGSGLSHLPAAGLLAGILRLSTLSEPKTETYPFYHYTTNAHALRKISNENQKPSYIDLFCGAGGLSLGLEQAGFKHAFSLDNDPWSIYTYRFNRPWIAADSAICCDIMEFNPSTHDFSSVDILCAGIPCQSFSLANQQRKEADPRDGLYLHYLNCVKIWRPKVALIENVSGFAKVNSDVVQSLETLGYSVGSTLVEVAVMGLPQYRKRLVYIAARNYENRQGAQIVGSAIRELKASMNHAPIPLSDAILDLPRLRPCTVSNRPGYESEATGFGATLKPEINGEISKYCAAINSGRSRQMCYNHKARFNNDRDIEIFSRLRPGEDSTAPSISNIMPYKSRAHVFKDKYYKLRPNTPCRTITSHMRYDCNTYIHPLEPRGLTAREAARVQGFPDDYIFCGTFQRTYQQIGNAVPPPLARQIGDCIIRQL